MNTRLFLFLIILLPVLVACGDDGATVNPPQIALDDGKLQFVSIENIGGSRDVVGLLEANITPPINQENRDRTYPQTSTISSDGERIIFQRDSVNMGMICVYQFSANASTCTDIGERIPEFIGGHWSPDGRYFVPNLDVIGLRQFRDIDILIYDTQDNRLINRTDDGVNYDDRLVGDGSEEIRAKIWMDVAPTWSPNGDLYFFRNAVDPSVDEWRADLMRIPANDITGTSPAEVILRHPSDLPFPVFRLDRDTLYGAMSISPNGQYLAFSSMSRPNDTTNGIWIVNLAEKTVKIHLDYNRLPFVMAGVPAWWVQTVSEKGIFSIAPRNLTWLGDSNRLVILLSNNEMALNLFLPPLKYDVSANTLESFYDYSTITEDDNLREITVFDDISLFADSNLRWAIPSPTNQAIFYVGRDMLSRQFVLSGMSIAETGFTTPRRIASFEDMELSSRAFASIGYNGDVVRILLGENLITLKEENQS